MATPSKVSLKKKKSRKLFTPTVPASQSGEEEDVEFEKENSDQVGSLGTFKSRQKRDRRNSTILAGNLSILNQDDDPDPALSPNVSLRREKIPSPKQTKPAVPTPAVDLLTEDESSFYSCDESQSLNRNVQQKDPWMTELTEEDEDDDDDARLKTPVHQNNRDRGQPHGSSVVRPATFFSVGKRKSLLKTNPRRVLAAGSDSSEEEEETNTAGEQPPHQATFVAASDGEEEEDEEDDVPLVDLGRKYLSDSKFGTVASWVTVSPFSKKPKELSQPSPSPESDDEEIESLLKSDPEDGEVRPSWAAPLPVSQNKSHQQSVRSSKAPLSTSSNKTSSYVGDRSSKAPLSTFTSQTSTSKTSTYVGDRSSKALLSTNDTSSFKASTYVGDRSSKALLSRNDTSSSKTSTYVGDRSSKAPLSVSRTLSSRTLDDKDLRSSKGELSSAGGSNTNQKSSNDFSGRSRTEENDSSKGEMRKSLEHSLVSRGPSYSSQADRITRPGILSEEKQLEELEETLQKIDNLEIEERHTGTVGSEEPSSNSEIQSSLLLGTKPKAKPKLLPIENSVNAVRCWVEDTEPSASHKDQQERHNSSSSDDFENFLTNLKSKKDEAKKPDSSGENFVVPDDEFDSDEESPKLSLRDRILKKSVVAKTKSGAVGGRVSSEDEDELPDIESPVVTKKKVNTIKQISDVYVISSDEDSAFDNLYEPKNYKSIPSPTPAVTPKLKKPVRRDKKKAAAEEKFRTPEPSSRTLTFLSSLTKDTPLARCHPEAVQYVKHFKTSKAELAVRLYHLYNAEIFGKALPDDMEITWNVRLTKTAGLCYSKRHRKYNIETRSSRIELSTKVIDSGDRLRDTLIHEMCHAASWIISGYRDGHGPLWRTWAEKAMRRFPELPVIDRCHSYQINTKYTYRCVQCGYSIGRHSKSLDTERKVCGHCHGRFQLVLNPGPGASQAGTSGTSGGKAGAPRTPRAPTPFANFVKENYKHHRTPGVSHGDVMKILSAKFSETKLK